MKRAAVACVAAVLVLLSLLALLASNLSGRRNVEVGASVTVRALAAAPEQIERGAYLARAGNCMACHTARAGAAYAGGRAVSTPFGAIYSTNLTPDAATGLGRWSADDFWRALHHGESKDGRLLYPAFPYTRFTLVRREDSDALFAWLQTLPPVQRAATPHALRWPYSTQSALAVWRALYFAPGTFEADPKQSAEWNRGAYLVRGLGHCGACHAARDALGGIRDMQALGGGKLPAQPWYAPSLHAPNEAGLTPETVPAFVRLMRDGVAPGAVALGPMAEVVQHSTQHLSSQDIDAMATYLLALAAPAAAVVGAKPTAPPLTSKADLGAKRYETHCAQCHGVQGQGVEGAYPALAGSRAVQLANSTNLVQVVLYGGFAPATAGNPRPFGMPPYVLTLDNEEIAAVLTHIRSAWGNASPPVTEIEVQKARSDETQ